MGTPDLHSTLTATSAFLLDVAHERKTKKRGWRIRSSTLLNSQLRKNYSPLQKVRS